MGYEKMEEEQPQNKGTSHCKHCKTSKSNT